MSRRIVLVAVLALALTGCSEGDGASESTASPAPAPQATEDQGVSGADPTSEASAPSSGECAALPYDDDGDYSAGEAGTVRIVLEGEGLVLEDVVPMEGWQHEVVTESDDEVEIAFTGEAGTATLHAALGDDGLTAVEVCAGA